MSSRFFRKSTTASSVSSGGSTTSSPARSSSPCSPARTTRLQEKEQLVGLNTRLAAYIEKVRSLEQENSRLSLQIKSSQDVVTREVSNIKELYEDELSATRRIMDETANDRAKLQIDLGNVMSEKDELASKLHTKERDLKKADDQLNLQEVQMIDLQARMTRSLHDKKKAEDELKDVKQEVVRLRRQLEETRAQLESESLSRVELENHLRSEREQFEFKSAVYEEQLKETRMHSSREIDLVDGSLQTEYEDRMNVALQELREQYEAKMAANREHFEKQYEKKLDELRGSQNRSQISTASTLKELRETRGRIESLTGRIAELEGANATLISRVRDLEIQLDNERSSSASLLAIKQEEIAALERRMQEQLQEYQDLMDLKVALDMEIAAYRKMLESEEARLNLSPLGHHAVRKSAMLSAGASPAGMRSGKRKRTVVETSEQTCTVAFDVANTSHGAIEICDECPDGKFVKLRNKTDKEVSLGGMQLVRKAGDNETDYKFHRAIKLGPAEETTVWAAEAGAIHDAPHSLVMRGQTWFIGNQMTTTLFDMEGEEIAKRVSHRENSSATMSHIEHENGANDSQSSDWSLLNLFGGKRTVRQ